jgi:hypothetical protein
MSNVRRNPLDAARIEFAPWPGLALLFLFRSGAWFGGDRGSGQPMTVRGNKPPRFFSDAAAAERFARRVAKAYDARKRLHQAEALANPNWREGVLEARLADRMAAYRSDRAAEISDGKAMAEVDRELEAIWPVFQEGVEAELTRDMKIMDHLKSALIKQADKGSE